MFGHSKCHIFLKSSRIEIREVSKFEEEQCKSAEYFDFLIIDQFLDENDNFVD